jgi:hypothetical protein
MLSAAGSGAPLLSTRPRFCGHKGDRCQPPGESTTAVKRHPRDNRTNNEHSVRASNNQDNAALTQKQILTDLDENVDLNTNGAEVREAAQHQVLLL